MKKIVCSKSEFVYLRVVFTCGGFDETVILSVRRNAPLSKILDEARIRFIRGFSPSLRHIAEQYEFKSLTSLYSF